MVVIGRNIALADANDVYCLQRYVYFLRHRFVTFVVSLARSPEFTDDVQIKFRATSFS